MTKTYLSVMAMALTGLAMTSCGKSNASDTTGGSSTPANAACASDTRVTAYADAMKVKGDAYTVQIMTADPSPPAEGLNIWTIQILDPKGAPVTGANVKLAPYMPDHGHGPSVVPQVAANGTTYTISNIDLFMPGVWQLTFSVTNGTAQDQAVVDFCVAG